MVAVLYKERTNFEISDQNISDIYGFVGSYEKRTLVLFYAIRVLKTINNNFRFYSVRGVTPCLLLFLHERAQKWILEVRY